MKLVAENLLLDKKGAAKVGARAFKSSQKKKSRELAFLATNLQVHLSSLSQNDSGDQPPEEPLPLLSITFGAPSAHCLGFKHGGLSAIEAKLQEQKTKRKKRQSEHSPEAALQQLELRFAAAAREGVVLCQALCALSTAGVEVMARCVKERSASKLQQFVTSGLLVHSVSLLSTSGKEEGMIEDFAAAYEKLRVTFRFVSTSDSTNQGDPESETPEELVLRVVDVQQAGKTTSGPGSSSVGPKRSTDIGVLTVTLGVSSDHDYEWICATAGDGGGGLSPKEVALVPVLFTLGKEGET